MTNTGDRFVEKLIDKVFKEASFGCSYKYIINFIIAETVKELDKRCLVMDSKRHDFVHAVCQDLLNQCGENK